MFRALSDQMFGEDTHHARLRGEVCDYIKTHEDHFRNFFSSDSGQSFDAHVTAMQSLGTFGDNFELVAFANLHCVDIHIYQNGTDNVMIINGASLDEDSAKEGPKPPPLHLA